MKEYCLVPVSIAQKFMFTQPPSPSKVVIAKKKISQPKPLSPSPMHPLPHNPSLEDLIRVSTSPAFREYGLSLVKLLDNKSGISWDEEGNFSPPFSGLNIIDIINTLGNPKATFSNKQKPLVKLLFHLAQIPSRAIRNISQKKKLVGMGRTAWLPY